MSGCLALTDNQIALMSQSLSLRDKTFLTLGVRTGFRVSELLSLKVSDVMQFDSVRPSITVTRANMKGSQQGRTVALHSEASTALALYIATAELGAQDFLFSSSEDRSKPISRQHAYRVIKAAANDNRIAGKIGTHSCRKTFGQRIYSKSGKDLSITQKAMGHKNVSSTISYLAVNQDTVDALVLAD